MMGKRLWWPFNDAIALPRHESVLHSRGEYVRGKITANRVASL